MYLPILTYHRLLKEAPDKKADPHRIAVSQDQFRTQLAWLHRLGYRTVPLDDYARTLSSEGTPPASKRFVITFDDGYEDVLTLGLPVLKEFGFTATVFAVADELGGVNRWDNGQEKLLTAAQYRELIGAGLTVGAHTCRHVHLTKVEPAEAQREIAESKRKLEDALGATMTLLAYPYGEYNDAVEAFTRDAGFTAAFTTDRAPTDHAGHPYRLRRAVIFPRNNAWEVWIKTQRWYPAYQDWKRRNG